MESQTENEPQVNLKGAELERAYAERIVDVLCLSVSCLNKSGVLDRDWILEKYRAMKANGMGFIDADYEARVQWVHELIQELRKDVGW